jgi:hypothetical protein
MASNDQVVMEGIKDQMTRKISGKVNGHGRVI